MQQLGTARRIVLSAAVPALAIACLLPVEMRVNERPFGSSDGIQFTTWDTFVLRSQWWFWPALIVATAVWCWVLWPSASCRRESAHE